MGKKYRRYRNFIEKYLASEKGKRFFHVAYCIGASIVILGALFKINHYAFGGTILFIGLITEAFIFFLSAFDAPAKEYKWEEVYPVLAGSETSTNKEGESDILPSASGSVQGAGGTVIIGGTSGGLAEGVTTGNIAGMTNVNAGGVTGIVGGGFVGGGAVVPADTADTIEASEKYAEQLIKASENMEKFAGITESLSKMSEALLSSFSTINNSSEGLGNNTQGYVTQMETLNRNLTGLNTIYEIQLKGVSGQIHTIEQINAGLDRIKKLYDGSLADSSIFKNETERMAQQLSELNRVYARMLQAMTVNMNMNLGGFNPPPYGSQQEENK